MKQPEIKKVLVIGSGPAVIGRSAEFDYAGTQALRTLKEEGLKTILINSCLLYTSYSPSIYGACSVCCVGETFVSAPVTEVRMASVVRIAAEKIRHTAHKIRKMCIRDRSWSECR